MAPLVLNPIDQINFYVNAAVYYGSTYTIAL